LYPICTKPRNGDTTGVEGNQAWRYNHPMQATLRPPAPLPDLYALSRAQMGALLGQWDYSDYYAGQLWSALYRDLLTDPTEMVALRPDLQDRLSADARAGTLRPRLETASSDGHTRKFLLALPDDQAIETVLMYFRGRATACLSTQVGCAMGCVFCATGQMGFRRHLSAGEIVAQAVFVARLLRQQGEALRNIVLMGMGEPLHNYDATLAAVDTLLDHRGLAIAPRFITLSTVGVVPGIRRLTAERQPIRLAVSLHGATDEARAALVPPARRWPLAELMDACRAYCDALGRRIFFEWTLIEGQNDTAEQAHQLGRLLSGLPSHVNLIPLNPTEGYDGRPAHTPQARAFQAILREYGLPSTVRQRRGIDVAAGCGQLATPAATR
jgi:23S rRNA (adenine2503-C2)-methyltransferase